MILVQRFRAHVPTLVGAGLLILVVDVLILAYRLMGLYRFSAVYAALLTFFMLGSLAAHFHLRPRNRKSSEVDEHGQETTPAAVE